MNQSKMLNRVRVWDLPTRVFHWPLVLAFIVAYISEDESDLHIYSGYIVLGLVLFRLVWGFVGSKHARFKDFIFSPSEILVYVKTMFSGTAKRYLGHNPLGGLMVFALLITLLMTTVSGLKVYGLEGYGPLSQLSEGYFISSAVASNIESHHDDSDDKSEELWEETHEFFANLMLFLIALHVIGVMLSSKLHNENLVKSMVNGYKVSIQTKGDES